MYVSLLMNYILLLSMLINSNVFWLCAKRYLQNYKCYVHVCQLKLVGIQPFKQSVMCNYPPLRFAILEPGIEAAELEPSNTEISN